jgi:hypothetical protein
LSVGAVVAICQGTSTDRDGLVLRNWILGLLASALWIGNYLVYFWYDIAGWWVNRRARRRRPWAPEAPGPLPRTERRRFPPPEPPPHPVKDAEVVPLPARRRRRT